MARKKTTQKDFVNSPFKSLKGLSAYETPPRQPVKESVAKPAAGRAGSSAGDEHSFADEMDFLGVKPLPGRAAEEPGAARQAAPEAPLEPRLSREEQDRAAFLAALGAMETTFRDEWPQDEAEVRATPRRMRQLMRGQLRPEAELDLHGLTVDAALAKVRFFLDDGRFHGLQTLLLITGKGLHSSEGPVLRQAVERLLAQLTGQVVEWGPAPRRLGGDGALVVFLRPTAPE